jgi:triosephosphate isomerase
MVRGAAAAEAYMRKLMVAGNWKMHGSVSMVEELMRGLLGGMEDIQAAEVVVFPPFPYLPMVQSLAAGSALRWGAQTLSPHAQGAYTGEVSASMLLDFGCRLVLVGHSERRQLFAESNEDVAERFAAALEAGLCPVLCLGETREQREAGDTEAVVAAQLDAVLQRSGIAALSGAVLAYEPVWAIGTGLTASPEQAQAVHAFIRDKLAGLDGTIAGQVQLLYGGSVKATNAADLFKQPDIDGALVGGASLAATDFLGICRAAG